MRDRAALGAALKARGIAARGDASKTIVGPEMALGATLIFD